MGESIVRRLSFLAISRYVVALGALLVLVGPANASTTISSLTVEPAAVAPGELVTLTIVVATAASQSLSGDASLSLSRNGAVVYQETFSGFLDAVDINTGTFRQSIGLPQDLYQTPGTYTVEVVVSGIEDGEIPVSDSASTNFVVEEAAGPITVQPASLNLQGAAGETPTASFVITSGRPPFLLSSANEEGRGTFSTTTAGLNESVTYGFRIPAGATDEQTFTDVITVKGADGATATIIATITAQVSGGQSPSQSEIDEAMQSIAQTPPQRAVAATISKICPAGVAEPRLQEDCNVVVGAALESDGSTEQVQAAQALGQITADQASAPVNASQISVLNQMRNVGTRLAALRSGAAGFSARGLSINLDGQSLPAGQIADALVRDILGRTGGAAGDGLTFGPWGFFVNGTINSGSKDATENVAGFDYDAWSVTLGADYRFRDNLVAGAALGYSKNDTDLDANGGNLDSDGFTLTLYGTYYLESGLYLDGAVGYSWNDFEQRRNIRYDIGSVRVDQSAKSDFDGSQWSASFGGGYSFSRGALSFGPTARLEYVETKVDGFQERMSNPTADGGGWATRIDDQDVSSFTSQIGAEVSYAVSTSWGLLIPNLQVQWVHEFEDGSENVVGHFVQDTSRTKFSLPTDSFDPDYFNLQLGLSAQFANGRSGFLYYRKLVGYSDLDAYTIGAGVRMEF